MFQKHCLDDSGLYISISNNFHDIFFNFNSYKNTHKKFTHIFQLFMIYDLK